MPSGLPDTVCRACLLNSATKRREGSTPLPSAPLAQSTVKGHMARW